MSRDPQAKMPCAEQTSGAEPLVKLLNCELVISNSVLSFLIASVSPLLPEQPSADS